MTTTWNILEKLDDDIYAVVAAVGAFVRALWYCHLASSHKAVEADQEQFQFEHDDLKRRLHRELAVRGAFRNLSDHLTDDLCEGLLSLYPTESGTTHIPRSHFQWPHLCWILLGRRRRPADLKYWALRELRSRYSVSWSASCVGLLLSLARAGQKAAEEFASSSAEWFYIAKALDHAAPSPSGDAELRWSTFFLELWALHGLAEPSTAARIELQTDSLNAESLVSRLFGMPTSIPGFDDMFGGGLMLVDQPDPLQHDHARQPVDKNSNFGGTVGGRTVLAIGPFGSGKSSLSKSESLLDREAQMTGITLRRIPHHSISIARLACRIRRELS